MELNQAETNIEPQYRAQLDKKFKAQLGRNKYGAQIWSPTRQNKYSTQLDRNKYNTQLDRNKYNTQLHRNKYNTQLHRNKYKYQI
ncbi:hypothetical protein METBIDRAFT_29755 [Metschnikowia bicuspidata var. bicuspidata NRRL YB-4993]|uniref:Uncharacterized protein n=1 Tax=Metschnikowia bicuspidata var. bicuspidata NRRL YB-4993 TaxID=869754 RepID=A0A1A0HHB6_9ASCO|nr:hypothetical protein METBIDRAFT_29755 [Metschnikowia bicuspidata var. bicuspidata NRRL YB-4993]OBA23233.1 hypothetical protein METBIDRAFT_29755 [Metschnikowia bicuspidata var. bicuspidata NRRL YB-4993]